MEIIQCWYLYRICHMGIPIQCWTIQVPITVNIPQQEMFVAFSYPQELR